MTSHKAEVDESVRKSLFDALKRLEQLDGVIEDKDIWSLADIDMSVGSTLFLEASHPLKESKRLEAVKKALQQLASSCERNIKALKKKAKSFSKYRGIDALPDDALISIFKAVLEVDDRNSRPVILSHVCSRFRNLALATPSLWSRIYSLMPNEYVKACLERSKGVNLSVTVFIDYGAMAYEGSTSSNIVEVLALHFASRFRDEFSRPTSVQDFLRLVTSSSRRWSSLRLILGKHADTGSITAIINRLSGLNLTNVESFEFDVWVKYLESLPDNLDLCRSWNMPKVDYMYLWSVQPARTSPFFSSTSIRSIKFKWNRSDLEHLESSRPDLQALGDFVASLPNLVDLSVDLDVYSEDENDRLPSTNEFVLQKLEKLEINIDDPDLFSSFVHGLRVPATKTLHLDLAGPVEKWLVVIPSETFLAVQELQFDLSDYQRGPLDLRRLLEKFPSLERLSVGAPNNFCPTFDRFHDDDEPQFKMPPIRSVSLTLASPVSRHFLSEFVEALEDDERYEEFKTFELKTNYQNNAKCEIEKLREDGKNVVWST